MEMVQVSPICGAVPAPLVLLAESQLADAMQKSGPKHAPAGLPASSLPTPIVTPPQLTTELGNGKGNEDHVKHTSKLSSAVSYHPLLVQIMSTRFPRQQRCPPRRCVPCWRAPRTSCPLPTVPNLRDMFSHALRESTSSP
jgi:hypothetical protein